MAVTADDTELLWSARGEVACRAHAPSAVEPRWVGDRWTPIPPSAQGRHGRRYQCQLCVGGGRVIQHQPRDRERARR